MCAMVGNKPWADQPYPLITTKEWESTDTKEHASICIALEMVRAHNCFIRIFNSIALQGPNIKQPADAKDFMYYTHCVIIGLHHHHSVEEKIFFPHVGKITGKPDLMEVNIGQHEGFYKGMDELDAYVTQTAPDAFDWPAMKKILDGFVPDLIEHLVTEVPTLLSLREYDSKELMRGWIETEDEAKTALKGDAVYDWAPLFFVASDRTYEDGFHKHFPPGPFFLPYLVRYHFSRKHADAWRFGPCDFFGKPRPLPFA